MSGIIERSDQILAFLDGEEPSPNDQQANTIKRSFEITRSNLAEYGILQTSPGLDFNGMPAPHAAVGTTQKPLIPFMVSLVPPDTYPGTESRSVPINAPQEIEVQPVRTRGSRGNFSASNEGSRVEGATDSSLVFEPRDIDMGNYLNTQVERYRNFQTQKGRVDQDLRNQRTNIVANRREVRDTFADRSAEIRQARQEEDNEGFIRAQILAMKDLPPLFMYVNPAEFSVSYNHVISDGNKGRDGYIIEHWGLQQPTISASGTIGATYIHASNRNGNATGGLTQLHRQSSAAYQNFMNLFQIYRNNSYIYNLDRRISVLGSVKIFYDGTIYTGSFDSFSITETETAPFTLEYKFDFTVRFQDSISSVSENNFTGGTDDMFFSVEEAQANEMIFTATDTDFDDGGDMEFFTSDPDFESEGDMEFFVDDPDFEGQ